MFPTPLQIAIDALAAGRATLLCGAGISRPSGLPDAYTLGRELISLLVPDEKDRELLVSEVFGQHRIPFEAFVEIVINTSGSGCFLHLFSEGQPSTAHLVVADLIRLRRLRNVVTTNFDLLFERAFSSVGLADGVDYRVIASDHDFSALGDLEQGIPSASLLKIHGSYASDTSEMLTTLRQVSRQRLLEARLRVVDWLFATGSHHLVVILGYSCSDMFDINPRIASLRPPVKQVILLDHSVTDIAINAISSRPEPNPFGSGFQESWWVRFDTAQFIMAIGKCLSLASSSAVNPIPASWTPHLVDWAALPKGVLNRITAALFRRTGHYELADLYYQRALTAFEIQGDAQRLGDTLVNRGVLYQFRCLYGEAMSMYERALRIAQAGGLDHIASTALYQLGRVAEETGRYSDALAKYEESRKLDERRDDQQGVATCLHQAGIVYQQYLRRYDDAERHYLESLRIKEELGDLEGLFNTTHQLSILAYLRGQTEQALRTNDTALALAEKLNYKAGIAYALSHRGLMLQALAQLDEAESCHQRALHIREGLGDRKAISRSFHNLSQVALRRGAKRDALRRIRQALTIKTTISDPYGLAEDWLQLSDIFLAAGHRQWAAAAVLKARDLFAALGSLAEVSDCEKRLAKAV